MIFNFIFFVCYWNIGAFCPSNICLSVIIGDRETTKMFLEDLVLYWIWLRIEAVVRKCSVKKVFLSFLVCNFIKKEALAQVFSCEFCAFSKNTFLDRTSLVAASVRINDKHLFFNKTKCLITYRNVHPTRFMRWCQARDFDGSQIPATMRVFEQQNSYIQCCYLTYQTIP